VRNKIYLADKKNHYQKQDAYVCLPKGTPENGAYSMPMISTDKKKISDGLSFCQAVVRKMFEKWTVDRGGHVHAVAALFNK